MKFNKNLKLFSWNFKNSSINYNTYVSKNFYLRNFLIFSSFSYIYWSLSSVFINNCNLNKFYLNLNYLIILNKKKKLYLL